MGLTPSFFPLKIKGDEKKSNFSLDFAFGNFFGL